MAIYYYTARNQKSEIIHGIQEAVNESGAVRALQGRGFWVTNIVSEEVRQAERRRSQRTHRKIKADDLIFLTSQASMLLDAGIPLLRSLEILSNLTSSQKLYEVLTAIIGNIRAGSTFKDSLARHPEHFPPFWPYLIEAGETSGNLSLVLHELSKNLESTAVLRSKIISALIYPGILFVGATGAVLVFMLKIIPIFEKIFMNFNAKLPPLTMAILAFSRFAQNYFLPLLGAFFVLFYLVRRFFKTAQGQGVLSSLLLKLPLFGPSINDVIHARISIIFSTLLKSGLNLLKSLEITSHVAGNTLFEHALNDASLAIQRGKSLYTALKDNPIFSPMFLHLIMIGEESGKLPEMIEKAAAYYENRAAIFAGRIGILIEPFILILVGIIVGVIVIAMFMPIFTLGTAIR